MPLLARTILTPLSIEISDGAIGRLGTVLADGRISASGRVAVVLGGGIGPELVEPVRATLPYAEILTISAGSLEAAMGLAARLRGQPYDAVVGIGGGRVIDTVKYAASQQGLPMVSVATSIAHDGLASPVSSLERDGTSISYGVHIPIAVVVDLDYVARSPAYQIRSGIGDALSNLSAIEDWQLSNATNGEPVDGLALAFARTGAEAVLHHPGSVADRDLLATLANALILGGVAMAVTGTSRPCSGACHEIAHALGEAHPNAASHGIGAGMGALFATFLRQRDLRQHDLQRRDLNQRDLRCGQSTVDIETRESMPPGPVAFDRLSAAMRRHGLPRVPGEIGLTSGQFAAVVAHAPATRPGRYTILEHLALDEPAIALAVEEYIDAIG